MFSSKRVLVEHKETCLKINGKQTVKLRSSSIKFKNFFKQLAVPFKMRILSQLWNEFKIMIEIIILHISKGHIPCSFGYNVFCVDDKFSKSVVLYRGKDSVNKFIEKILKEYDYCKTIIKKLFNKNLVMSAEDKERFQSRYKCWICNKYLISRIIKWEIIAT